MKKHKLLIADDDRAARKTLRERLSSWGYAVVEAADGLSVVSQCLREQPAAIILDHGMPNGDGQSIARLLRRECEIPIIFVSGHERELFREAVMAASEMYYLAKPVDMDRLRGLLADTISHRCER